MWKTTKRDDESGDGLDGEGADGDGPEGHGPAGDGPAAYRPAAYGPEFEGYGPDEHGFGGDGSEGYGYDGDGPGGYGDGGGYLGHGPDGYGTPGDLAGPGDPNAYWRRRFAILAGGIVALGLCAWLFPGGHQASRPSAAASASMAALASGKALPAAAYGSAWPGRAHGGQAGPRAGHSPSARPRAAVHPAAHPAAHAARPKAKIGLAYHPGGRQGGAVSPCKPSDIVLSLFTSQPGYGQKAKPEFDVYAVSTSPAACTMAYGPGSVRVIVTRRGRVVWNSATCKPPAARRTRFTLGVPRMLAITWNRGAGKPPGCAGSLSAGAWGTFDAVAMTGGQTSRVRSFKLAR